MSELRGFFDKLYFTESVLGPPQLNGDHLSIPVAGLMLLAGHPLESEGRGPHKGVLLFDGVGESRRSVTEYIGDSRRPDGFKPACEVVDVDNTSSVSDGAYQEFGFEGYQEEPSAWIDNWLVRAKSFTLRLL